MTRYVPGLNGVRALSVLGVAAMHLGLCAPGWIGVQLFYVLSGFLITGGLLQAKLRFQHIGPFLADFYRRRFARIMPLYLLYLAVITMVALCSHTFRHDLHELPFLLTYTYNFQRGLSDFRPTATLAAHLWSLSVEEQFYLLWPFLVFYCSRKNATRAVMGTAALALLLRAGYILAAGHAANTSYAVYFLTPFQVDGFALGALLAFVPQDRLRAWRLPMGGAAAMLLLAGACLNHHLPDFGLVWVPRPRISVWLYTVIDLVGAWLVLECSVPGSPVPRLLEIRPLRFLGQISYGFYVWHWSVLVAVHRFLPSTMDSTSRRWWAFAGEIVVVGFLASISYYAYEQPAMRWLRPSGRQGKSTHTLVQA